MFSMNEENNHHSLLLFTVNVPRGVFLVNKV
jgi:hypothetical protein